MILGALCLSIAMVAQEPPKPLPDLPDWVFTVEPEEEDLDVLHFGDSGPTLIRLRVRINGRGFRSAWDGCLARLYQYVDANDDGIVTEAEFDRPGWRKLFTGFGLAGSMAPKPAPTASGPSGPRVSVEEFRSYVRDGLGQGPLTVQSGHAADPVDQAAFNAFDLDRDGALGPTELTSAAADALLRRLDLDEDEMVDRGELDPTQNPYAGVFFASGASVAGDPLAGPLVALATPEARERAGRRLLDRYGRAGLDPPQAIILSLRLLKDPGQAPALVPPAEDEGPSRLDPRLAASTNGGWTIGLDGRKVQLAPNDAVRDLRQFYDMRFPASDLNKDDSLDRAEANKGFFFVRFFDAADRNGDDRLARAELALFLERLYDLGKNRATIDVSEDGRAVFEILDGDGDGRLGRRELREASRRLKPFDLDGDGRIRLGEIPPTCRVQVGRGVSSSNRGFTTMETYDTPAADRPSDGKPVVAWFRKMDRNRDGDVSPAEFLGPAADFRKLDADHDGLIDPREAAKGP